MKAKQSKVKMKCKEWMIAKEVDWRVSFTFVIVMKEHRKYYNILRKLTVYPNFGRRACHHLPC